MKKSRLIYLTLNACHFEHGDALGYHVLRGRSGPWTLCKDSDGLQIFQVHRLRFRMFRTKIRTAEILWNHCWSFLQQSDRLFTVKDKVRGGWGTERAGIRCWPCQDFWLKQIARGRNKQQHVRSLQKWESKGQENLWVTLDRAMVRPNEPVSHWEQREWKRRVSGYS